MIDAGEGTTATAHSSKKATQTQQEGVCIMCKNQLTKEVLSSISPPFLFFLSLLWVVLYSMKIVSDVFIEAAVCKHTCCASQIGSLEATEMPCCPPQPVAPLAAASWPGQASSNT